MIIEINIVASRIDKRPSPPTELAVCLGAVAEFTGIVRSEENGHAISALAYEAYQPMAEQTMRSIIETVGQRRLCLWVRVTHRIGIVPVGEAAIHVIAGAVHRAEALAMIGDFMDRLKQDVPIWKTHALDPTGRPLPPSP
jgi:molybdopterin synthase catalytic subunit